MILNLKQKLHEVNFSRKKNNGNNELKTRHLLTENMWSWLNVVSSQFNKSPFRISTKFVDEDPPKHCIWSLVDEIIAITSTHNRHTSDMIYNYPLRGKKNTNLCLFFFCMNNVKWFIYFKRKHHILLHSNFKSILKMCNNDLRIF